MSRADNGTHSEHHPSDARFPAERQNSTMPLSRAAANLQRQIAAVQRAMESLDLKMNNARVRNEFLDYQVIQAQYEGLRERRDLLQDFSSSSRAGDAGHF